MEYQIRIGGLMRCCTHTIDEAMQEAKDPPKEGDLLRCQYCRDESGMRFHDGAWEWAYDPKKESRDED